jgi:N utilization substance protein A
VEALFRSEIPEINEGSVRIDGVAREPGSRSKVAVSTNDDRLDPVGACIGQRGARIQTIIAELSGEKIDMIEWDEDPGVYVMNALEPAQVVGVTLDEEKKIAQVIVKEDQLSVAIGRGGQNVRLASKLTGWVIRIATEGGEVRGSSEGAVEGWRGAKAPSPEEAKADEEKVEAAVEEQIAAAEVAEQLAVAEASADGDDTLAEVEDEKEAEAQAAEMGLEAETLPSATAENADAKDGDA